MGSESLIILDTHVLVWLLEGSPQLGPRARRSVDRATQAERLAVSAISFWEIAMLERKRRLDLAQRLEAWRHQSLELGVIEISVSGDIGIAAAVLTDFHADPADRIITATTDIHRGTLVTADDRILQWSGPLKRLDARL